MPRLRDVLGFLFVLATNTAICVLIWALHEWGSR